MFKETIEYLLKNKKWWLIPPIVTFLLLGLVTIFSASSPVSPFIYMLF